MKPSTLGLDGWGGAGFEVDANDAGWQTCCTSLSRPDASPGC